MTLHADSAQVARNFVTEPDIGPVMYLAGFRFVADFAEIVAPLQMLSANARPLRGKHIGEVALAGHLFTDDVG